MPPKRPIQNVFGNDDDDFGASQPPNGTPPKKPRPDSRSTLQRAGVAPQNGSAAAMPPPPSAAGENSIQAQVAAAKARAQALMSAMQNKGQIPPARPAAPPPANTAPSRFAPLASARPPPTSATAGAAARPPAGGASSIQAQLEAARAKVQAQMAALQNKNKVASTPSTSSVTSAPSASSSSAITSTQASSSKAPTGIHPLLLSNDLPSSASTSKSSPFIKSRSTNVPPEANPYLQASRAAAEEAAKSTEGPKQRSMHKGFQFHRPGRHILEAEELRREQQMEEIKKRIEESARKAGMQDELDGDEKRLARQPPPEVEWWDVNLLRSRTYDDIPDSLSTATMIDQAKATADYPVKLYGHDSPIDHYVQHPIPIPAPSEKFSAQPRGLMLTKKEQRKLRRQRRAAELQDKRDRIKMGLLPPEPPKVKLSNLMRVLTSEAVSDPTKIEARVRREIAARKEAHERQNAERKLNDEQRREKKQRKKEDDEKKGLFCQVYRIRHLVSPRHKFKVRRNAQDHALTGVCVFHPSMAVVVVEGSAKALKAYKRLMTVRIDWTDPGQPKDEDEEEAEGEQEKNANNVQVGGFRTLTTSQQDVNWAENECELIFEGPIRERNWEGRGFRAVGAETDSRAREVLGEKLQGYWDVAKRVSSSQADVI